MISRFINWVLGRYQAMPINEQVAAMSRKPLGTLESSKQVKTISLINLK